MEPTEPRISNILSSDVEIKGTISLRQALQIDGRVEGEINAEGALTIGETGIIRGDIVAKSVMVFGKVFGNITAVERCELKSRASLQGDLQTARVVVEEGASFVGKSFVESWDAAQILQRLAEKKPVVEREAKGRGELSENPKNQSASPREIPIPNS